MKRYAAWIILLAFLMPRAFAAEEAVVNDRKINVRGQPTLHSEVVTQLEKGDKVTIFETVPAERPRPGDPTNWAKIKLPANTPVWVFAPFVKEGKVTATRLNLRAGPGENFSVLGRVEKGTDVKEIRAVDSWLEIEAPADAYAFVDATLLTAGSDATLTAATPAPVESVTPPATKAVPEQPSSTEAAPVPATSPGIVSLPQPQPATVPAESPVEPPADTAQPPATSPPTTAATPSPATQPQTLPEVAPAQPEEDAGPPPKRVVRREGIVRPTRSIQAPTPFELAHPETKKAINYLHGEKIGVNLGEFRGMRVVVTGEEGLDARWPKTPVLELESIDTVP